MAWNAAVPTDNGLLINAPGQIRANWDAIALGTDSALLITDAKISPSAAISDSKLAQITTAGKVSGAAITSISSLPSGAGTIPLANIPSTLTGKSADQLDAQDGAYYLALGNATGTLAIANGGTGQTSANNALNALLPSQTSNANKVLTTDGSNTSWGSVSSMQVFTASGTFTVPAGIYCVYLTGISGGGGSGGGNGSIPGGGGGGGILVVNHPYFVSPSTAYTVTIGAGGTAGTSDGNGGTGGSTIFNDGGTNPLTLTGGGPGIKGTSGGTGGSSPSDPSAPSWASSNQTGGLGGNRAIPEFHFPQGNAGTVSGTRGGGGGGTVFGAGADGQDGAPGASPSASSYGAGAGGGGRNQAGAAGAAGYLIVSW